MTNEPQTTVETGIDLLERLAMASCMSGRHDIEAVLLETVYRLRQTQAIAHLMAKYIPFDELEAALATVPDPFEGDETEALLGEQQELLPAGIVVGPQGEES